MLAHPSIGPPVLVRSPLVKQTGNKQTGRVTAPIGLFVARGRFTFAGAHRDGTDATRNRATGKRGVLTAGGSRAVKATR